MPVLRKLFCNWEENDMVEWKKLGEIEDAGILRLGRGQIISKTDMRDNPGDFPVYSSSSQGDGEIGRYGLYMFDDERITWSIDGGGKLFYRNGLKYSVTNVGGWLKVYRNDIYKTKFLYYLLYNQWTTKVFDYTHKAHPSVIRDEYLIPDISIHEQTRIVEILDTFTASIANLKEQIKERRKQYEYYRDQLLDLEGKDGVKMKTLGEVGDVCMCKRIMKNQTSDKGDVPFYKIGTFGSVPDSYISRELFESYKKLYSYPKKGDVLISASGTIGRTVVFDGKEAYFQDSNIVWIDNNEVLVTNSFLKYLYEIIEWKTDGGTIKRLYNYNLKSAIIYIPSLAEQHRIVSILDQFEASIANLEAQLKEREKQYEYYRNQLLTFE